MEVARVETRSRTVKNFMMMASLSLSRRKLCGNNGSVGRCARDGVVVPVAADVPDRVLGDHWRPPDGQSRPAIPSTIFEAGYVKGVHEPNFP